MLKLKICIWHLISSLFEKSPETKPLFGFKRSDDPASAHVQQSQKFTMHAHIMVQMIDKTMNVLGPDVDILSEILMMSAKKHVRFGVEVDHFHCLVEALLETLQLLLKDSWGASLEESWREVFSALSAEMIKAMNHEKAVMQSWEKLKQLDNYAEVSGSILFQNLFQLAPESKLLFDIPIDTDPTCETLLASPRFKMHSSYFVELLDKALNMMEAKQLEDKLAGLGKSHASMGVTPNMFQSLGKALLVTLQKLQKDDWNEGTEEAWVLVYEKLSKKMIQAVHEAKRRQQRQKKKFQSVLERQTSFSTPVA